MTRLRSAAGVQTVIVAVPPGAEQQIAAELSVMTVAGGATRQESVRAALAVLPDDVDIVLVHDAARPLAPVSLIEAVAQAVRAARPRSCRALPSMTP